MKEAFFLLPDASIIAFEYGNPECPSFAWSYDTGYGKTPFWGMTLVILGPHGDRFTVSRSLARALENGEIEELE